MVTRMMISLPARATFVDCMVYWASMGPVVGNSTRFWVDRPQQSNSIFIERMFHISSTKFSL